MRVLVVTNMYPTEARPDSGVFIQREVEALKRVDPELEFRVLHIDTVGSRFRYLGGPPRVAKAVRSFRPDILHVHYGLTQILSLGIRVPGVVTFHGSDLTIPWQRSFSVQLASLAGRRVVVVSPRLLGLLPDSLRSHARVIGCGVDPIFAASPQMPSRPPLRGSVVRIAFPSSPERPGKGFPLFEAAISALRRAGYSCEVVVLSGFEPRDVPDVLRGVDVLLMTSLHEGSPVVTREAMCCGARVVSVDVGDVADQVAGFSGCRIVHTRNPRDLADAVVASLCEAGPNPSRAFKRFSTDREAAAVLSLYREVTG